MKQKIKKIKLFLLSSQVFPKVPEVQALKWPFDPPALFLELLASPCLPWDPEMGDFGIVGLDDGGSCDEVDQNFYVQYSTTVKYFWMIRTFNVNLEWKLSKLPAEQSKLRKLTVSLGKTVVDNNRERIVRNRKRPYNNKLATRQATKNVLHTLKTYASI